MNGDWFYTAFGAMSHFRRLNGDGGFDPMSVCDIPESVGGWYGHDTVEDRERLAFLKKCRICKDKARLP